MLSLSPILQWLKKTFDSRSKRSQSASPPAENSPATSQQKDNGKLLLQFRPKGSEQYIVCSPKKLKEQCQTAQMFQSESGQLILKIPSREKLSLFRRYQLNRLRPEDIYQG